MSRLMDAATSKSEILKDIPSLGDLYKGEFPEPLTKVSNFEFSINKNKMMGNQENTLTSFFARACVGPDADAIADSIKSRANPDQDEEDPTNAYAHLTLKMKSDFDDSFVGSEGFCKFVKKMKQFIPVPLSCTFVDGAYHFCASGPVPAVVPPFAAELIKKIPATQTKEI